MGVGPNYVLDKGFLLQGSTAIAFGELAIEGTVEQSCNRSGANGDVIGVFQETVDAGRVGTGKVFADVRLLGISRVLCGATVAKGDRLKADATARAIPSARSIAGALAPPVFGRALTGGTVGTYIDVLLTPGATY